MVESHATTLVRSIPSFQRLVPIGPSSTINPTQLAGRRVGLATLWSQEDRTCHNLPLGPDGDGLHLKYCQVYGYGAYSCPPCLGLMTWRNPSVERQNLTFTLRKALSLPKVRKLGSCEEMFRDTE